MDRERQLRRGRQVVEPPPPVGAVALVRGGRREGAPGQHAVAEAGAVWRSGQSGGRILDERAQLVEHELQAGVVEHEQVDREVQAHGVVGAGDDGPDARPARVAAGALREVRAHGVDAVADDASPTPRRSSTGTSTGPGSASTRCEPSGWTSARSMPWCATRRIHASTMRAGSVDAGHDRSRSALHATPP